MYIEHTLLNLAKRKRSKPEIVPATSESIDSVPQRPKRSRTFLHDSLILLQLFCNTADSSKLLWWIIIIIIIIEICWSCVTTIVKSSYQFRLLYLSTARTQLFLLNLCACHLIVWPIDMTAVVAHVYNNYCSCNYINFCVNESDKYNVFICMY